MSKFKFIVHHDLEIKESEYIKDEITGKGLIYKPLLSEYAIPGHAYAELDILGESFVQGFYSKGYDDDKNRLMRAQDYQASHPKEKILFSKEFNIDEESANKILAAMPSHNGKSNQFPLEVGVKSYNVFQHNCSDYVNVLFKLTGLPGLYSWYFTSSEANEIPGLIKGYIFAKMRAGDQAQIVTGISKEEVAEKYNIDPDLISEQKPDYIPLDIDAAYKQESVKYFLIAPNPLLTFARVGEEIAYDEAKELISIAKTELEKEQKNISESLDMNTAINDVLSNPAKLAAYQQQSMTLAMQGLSELDFTIPGLGDDILKAARESQREYGDISAAIINPTRPKERSTGGDDNDWLTNLISSTQVAMNQANNDPDMQQFLKMLGDNTEFKFEDNT